MGFQPGKIGTLAYVHATSKTRELYQVLRDNAAEESAKEPAFQDSCMEPISSGEDDDESKVWADWVL